MVEETGVPGGNHQLYYIEYYEKNLLKIVVLKYARVHLLHLSNVDSYI
jgi:hypothetical protein